jgi:hypothetical protein
MRHPDDQPTSFLTLEPGTPVVDRFGRPVGEMERVLLLEGGGFDGIIVRTRVGRRFVDAPEVRRISRGAVTLGTTVDEVESPATGDARVHGVPAARYGRTEVTEADRDAVIEALKGSYVRDELTTDALGERVASRSTCRPRGRLRSLPLDEALDERQGRVSDVAPAAVDGE